ncbi:MULTISPECIES: DUF4124 domain-containing protein [unclassified Shewanella]|uniref:DUF4124 domain-containing protein n=1 Tax=unclassified Shewanella TaxID=196818 RepID=UPI000C856AB6|nr:MULTISPECIES: DUF4124 domain-containing protein [unclassified Shewanella]MDO6618449.1 DUF4124 domain-containing protein [Shewanella sp. 6_MG-2023]MDO6640266.1 DUF4124 domain-containing protein [Shewanella sp. 5_MG-2023]MDO6679656.1 DUF4124 domain-containing protein [Shewanella sp. 4_MG-2023]MDO6774423.1 DUF4124 domain-containing protein [Shewanella sp. 3_MG-2023]PMG28892.1 hypothetical protein BCU94_03340 [Shewanella sp. 10N.286.52.C2]
MRLTLLITLILCSVIFSISHATVYRWVDEQGNVHYSDQPRENAEQVELSENTQNSVAAPTVIETDSSPKEAKPVEYRVRIVNPTQEETIRNNNGNFTVVASAAPELPSGFLMALYIDDLLYGQPQSSSIFNVTEVNRGEHNLVVKVLTQNGKVLASSSPRKIFLHQASVFSIAKPRPLPSKK